MKELEVRPLALEGVQVIRYGRFADDRGYFTETYRKSDFDLSAALDLPAFPQCNESFSRPGTVRGLHFQWDPYMGKLVRTVYGRMVDFVLDIRKGSPSYGTIIAHDMPANGAGAATAEWIWIPPGFAHGNLFTEETLIEYFCTSEYAPGNETAISPVATDLDWSRCDPALKALFDDIAPSTSRMTDKDRNGHSLAAWTANPLSDKFVYSPPA